MTACPVHVDARALLAAALPGRLDRGAPGLHAGGAVPARDRALLRRPLPGGLRARAGRRRHPHPRARARGDGRMREEPAPAAAARRAEARPRRRRRRRSERPHGRLRARPQGLLRGGLRGAGQSRRPRPRARRGRALRGRPRGGLRAPSPRPARSSCRSPPVALARPRGANALAGLAPDVDAVYLAMGAAEADAGAALGYAARRRGQDRRRPGHAGDQQAGHLLRRQHPATLRAVVAHRLDRRRAPGGAVDRPAAAARLARGVARRPRRLRDRADRQPQGVASEPPASAADPARGYSRDEAAAEAARCLQCECLECVKACAYLEKFGAYPGQVRAPHLQQPHRHPGQRQSLGQQDDRLVQPLPPLLRGLPGRPRHGRGDRRRPPRDGAAGPHAGLGLRLRRARPAARRRRAVRAGAARPRHRRERCRVLPRLPARGVGSGPGGARLRVSARALLAGDRAAAVLLRRAGRLGRPGAVFDETLAGLRAQLERSRLTAR